MFKVSSQVSMSCRVHKIVVIVSSYQYVVCLRMLKFVRNDFVVCTGTVRETFVVGPYFGSNQFFVRSLFGRGRS